MKNKLLFVGTCLMIFLSGMVFSWNITPYYDSSHYERHWGKAVAAAAIALLFISAAWEKATKDP